MVDIKKFVDKPFEKYSFKELADSPIEAFQGISLEGGKMLKETLKIKTIRDLANNKFVKWAIAITTFADWDDSITFSKKITD